LRHRAPGGKVTELLRRSIFIALTLSVCARFCAPPAADAAHPSFSRAPKTTLRLVPADAGQRDDVRFAERPDTYEPLQAEEHDQSSDIYEDEGMSPAYQPPATLEGYTNQGEFEVGAPGDTEYESRFSKLSRLGLHHSSVNGRNVGIGVPLVGTSWANRPYYVGFDYSTLWVTQPPIDNVRTDTDLYGGLFAGCELDHYWGVELAVHRATPELVNSQNPSVVRGDRMMVWTANLMYYPWGDSWFRPYWRCGIGGMAIDFPNDQGVRLDETLWAFPIGLGIKIPLERWLAARAELTDQIGIGNEGIATQHDIALTFGLEWRLGAQPRSYWPWNPSRHIW
jgi:hypothetical protein